MKWVNKMNQEGVALVELLVVIVIFGIMLMALIGSFGNTARSQLKADNRIEATQYAIEGMEAAYNFSVNDWSGINEDWIYDLSDTNVPYLRIEYSPSSFSLVENGNMPEEIDGGKYERKLYFEVVCRRREDEPGFDNKDEIMESEIGCKGITQADDLVFYEDTEIYRIRSEVTWDSAGQAVVYETYLANYGDAI